MTAPSIADLRDLLYRWPAHRIAATARSLVIAAVRGPLTAAQACQLQAELERIRPLVREPMLAAIVRDPMLDSLFLDPTEFREFSAMMDQPPTDTHADIDDLVAELGQMYANDPDRGTETESAFYKAGERTNQIGIELCRRGGLAAMGRAHDALLEQHGNGAASMLRCQWRNAEVCGWSVGWTMPATA